MSRAAVEPIAPVDAQAIRAALRSTLGASRTLPPEAYLSEEVLAWERSHFFEGSWVCLGRAEELSGPGVVREWHGWAFADASGYALPFEEHVGNLDELVAPWEPERLFVAAKHEYVVNANWKTITENYHECYHCPSIHPALCKVTPVDSGENFPHNGCWVGGNMELMDFAETMSFTGRGGGVPIRGLDEKQRREVYYYGLFPNLLISLHPDYVMTHRMDPLTPGKTWVECSWLFPPEVTELADFDPSYASEFWDVTNREDWAACESVQRGLASRGARQGPFAWNEDEVHLFMAIVGRGYLEGRIFPPPQANDSGGAAS